MAIGKSIVDLELAIGYRFNDITYLENAITHSSYTNEQRTRGITAKSNERLEFLGDAVLESLVSEYLYFNFKRHREGALTKMRQRLVCEETLARIAAKIDLGSYLNLGHGEETNGGRERPKILADAMEAVIAAMYLDSSASENFKSVVYSLLSDEFKRVDNARNTDYKTLLQQLVEQEGSAVLEYRLIGETGPQHKKSFTVVAYVNNNEVGRGTAQKIQGAEMQAAKAALELFGVVLI